MSSLWTHMHAAGNAAATGATIGNAAGASSALRPGNNSVTRSASTTPASAAAASATANGSAAAADSSSNSGATVTANDFLTLLVSEMQNQDPTANTDPNAYIDQLVQINSLEQLIAINGDLSEVLGAASSSSTSPEAITARSGPVGSGGIEGSSVGQAAPHSTPPTSGAARHAGSHYHVSTSGNLSVPAETGAAATISRSLGDHTHARRGFTEVRDFRSTALSR